MKKYFVLQRAQKTPGCDVPELHPVFVVGCENPAIRRQNGFFIGIDQAHIRHDGNGWRSIWINRRRPIAPFDFGVARCACRFCPRPRPPEKDRSFGNALDQLRQLGFAFLRENDRKSPERAMLLANDDVKAAATSITALEQKFGFGKIRARQHPPFDTPQLVIDRLELLALGKGQQIDIETSVARGPIAAQGDGSFRGQQIEREPDLYTGRGVADDAKIIDRLGPAREEMSEAEMRLRHSAFWKP